MATVIHTQRGKTKLIECDYVYHFHSGSKNGTRSYWRCEQREICNARCTTNSDIQNQIQVFKTGTHTHEPNRAEVVAQSVTSRIKRRAEQHPNEPPAAIIQQELAQINDEEVRMNLPERNTLLRAINRSQNKNRPQVPQSLEHCIIIEPYINTLSGQLFLQYDSGAGDPNRYVIFYTEGNLRRLCQSARMYCDGTFKSVPRIFYQLYTIHGTFHDHVFPFIYALCSRKDQVTYDSIFRHLKTAAQRLNTQLHPQFVTMDFEIQAINAAHENFPDSSVKGCLFHFGQSVWRQVVSLGLREAFLNDEIVRRDIRQLLAIPFVPVNDVMETFDNLAAEIHDDLQELFDYFEYIYLRGRPARGRRRPVLPRFPPDLWNVYDLVQNRVQRTNNFVEGWHSKFQRAIVTHHANIWKFLEHIRKDEHDNETIMLQLIGGHQNVRYPINKRYVRNQRQIEEIVARYEEYRQNNDITTYLRALSYELKLHSEIEEDPQQDEN